MKSEDQAELLGKRKREALLYRGAILLVLLTAGLVYYWIHSPTYAVLELEQSIKDRDLATFYSRIDLNRIYDSSLDAGAVLETGNDSSWDAIQANIGAGVNKVLKSQVMNSVKHDIELQFRRDVNASLETKSPTPVLFPISIMREFFEDSRGLVFGKLARLGDIALVNVDVSLKKMAKSYPLTLKLEKVGEWKVTGFEGLASSLSLYEKDRVSRVNDHNAKVEREFKNLVPFFGQIREEPKLFEIGQELKFEFLFQNKGTSPLDRIQGVLTIHNIKGETVLKEAFSRADLHLNRNEKKVFLLSKDIGVLGNKVSFADGLTLHFEGEMLRFADGKILQIVKDYGEL